MQDEGSEFVDEWLQRMEAMKREAAEQMRRLALEARSQSVGDDSSGLRLLTGMDSIRTGIRSLADRCTREQLSMHPNPPGKEALEATAAEDRATLERGVRMRGLLTTAVRSAPHAVAYYGGLVDAGLEMRVTDRLSALLIIVDREAALLHVGFTAGGEPRALLVESELVVATLADLFDRTWESAWPLGTAPEQRKGELTTRQAEIMRLAAAGAKDEAIARQLGVSTRTLSHEFASAMSVLGARSRFQAGVLWTGEG